MTHESKLHKENCFITLTYDQEHLPRDYSTDVSHFQLFMKRLRKKYDEKKIRFYHCGEYGDTFRRPHYHAILFGFDFPDKKFKGTTDRGDHTYNSESLTSLWGKGLTELGSFTFESAAYVARYCTKKITGDKAQKHYEYLNPLTGELIQQKPEYATMSRRPGIGKEWYDKYGKETYDSDSLVIRGKEMQPPKFYDNLLDKENPKLLKRIKKIRKEKAQARPDNKLDPADRQYPLLKCAIERSNKSKRNKL